MIRISPCLLALLLIAAPAMRANDLPDLTSGFTPPEIAAGDLMGGFPLGNVDSVNPYSGRLGVSIPLRSIGGRGDLSHAIIATLQQPWTVDASDNCPSGASNCSGRVVYSNPDENPTSSYEVGYGPGFVESKRTIKFDPLQCLQGKVQETLTRIIFHSPGGEIVLRDVGTNGKPFVPVGCYENYYTNNSTTARNRGKIFASADGSNITFVSATDYLDDRWPAQQHSNGTLYFPNGGRYTISNGRITAATDRNGNEMVYQYTDGSCYYCVTKIIDPLLRETTINYNYDCTYTGGFGFSPEFCHEIVWKGEEGTQRKAYVAFDYLNVLLQTGHYLTSYQNLYTGSGVNINKTGNFNPMVVGAVMLPDGKLYKMRYNAYGEVIRLELPTHARIEYTWMNGVTGGTTGGYNSAGNVIMRRVKLRRTYADLTTTTSDSYTEFAFASESNCSPLSTLPGFRSTVKQKTSGGGAHTRSETYYCGAPGNNNYPGPSAYPSWKNGRSYKTALYDDAGGGTILQDSLTTWKQYPLTGTLKWWTGDENSDGAPPERARVDNVVSTDYTPTPDLVTKQSFKYDARNNRTDVYAYDFGGTNVVQRTHTDYVNSSTYLDVPVHLKSLPSAVYVCGAGSGDCTSGAAASKTEFVYDTGSLTTRSNATNHHTASFGTSYTTRGLLTKVRRWRNLPTEKWIEAIAAYDILGNPVSVTDPLGNVTTATYTDNLDPVSPTEITGGKQTFAFPTTVSNALTHSASTKFDYYLGRVKLFTDPNGVQTAYDYEDGLERLTLIVEANNYSAVKRQTAFEYIFELTGGVARGLITQTKTDQYNAGDYKIDTRTTYDSFGRVLGTQGEDCRFVERFYDNLGRPSGTTNPSDAGTSGGNCRWYSTQPYQGILYIRSQGAGWPIAPTTTTTYDKSGRVTKVTATGSAEYKTEYYGDRVRKIDPAGKKRDFYSNSLGQLIKVIEDPGVLNYITEYTYDALGKLTVVYQKGNNSTDTQTRYFDYDSLGRLIEADNPEASDTTTYAYDDAGNMTSKTDPRNVVTTVAYDQLNRVSVKSYSDGTPTERFCYDGKVLSGTSCVTPGTAIPFSVGRMTVSNSVWNQRSVLAFDAMGRVLSDRQYTVTVTSPWTTEAYTFSYTYYRNGSIASQTYPSGKVINYTYDTYNRPDLVSQAGGESFVLSRRFAGHGGAEEIRYGNFLRQKYCYNDRLQMTGTELSPYSTPYGAPVDCVNIASNLITLNFNYGSANHNNGNIIGQTIGASSDDVWQQYYTYDGTNRIAMASENATITGSTCPGGATWCRKYGYDHFGNRWISASLDTLHMATPTAQSGVSLATNRLTSGTYDAAGNLTAQANITTGGGSMAYDANNLATSFTATGVSVATKYDSAGRRVRKIHNSKTTIWVYDAFGKLAAEYSTETQTTPVGTYYRTTDHLGSTRLVTDDLGRVRQRHDFFPFGEQIPASGSFGNRQDVIDGGFATYNASLSVRHQFTGQQRDAETGLDYFWARNMAAPLGRFLSMDPENKGAIATVPQSWNAYGYAHNSPHRFNDPNGMQFYGIGLDGHINCQGYDPETGAPLANRMCDPFFLRPSQTHVVYHPMLSTCRMGSAEACAQVAADLYGILPFNREPRRIYWIEDTFDLFEKRAVPSLIQSVLGGYEKLASIEYSVVTISSTPTAAALFTSATATPAWNPLTGKVEYNINFQPSNYDPNNIGGISLIAHELSHIADMQEYFSGVNSVFGFIKAFAAWEVFEGAASQDRAEQLEQQVVNDLSAVGSGPLWQVP